MLDYLILLLAAYLGFAGWSPLTAAGLAVALTLAGTRDDAALAAQTRAAPSGRVFITAIACSAASNLAIVLIAYGFGQLTAAMVL